jgi:cohesin complex subunit SCC1
VPVELSHEKDAYQFQFFSEAILAKRGPLAKVWLAAHMERKLSKTQTLQTNIGTSVGT